MGNYPIQPVHVKDVAKVAIEEGQGSENTVDVTGPETYLQAYIRLLVDSMGIRRLILPMPPVLTWLFGRVLDGCFRTMLSQWQRSRVYVKLSWLLMLHIMESVSSVIGLLSMVHPLVKISK